MSRSRRRPAENESPSPRGGLISALKFQRRDTTRVSVFIDDEFAFGMSAELAAELGFNVGRTIAESDAEEALRRDGVIRAKQRAFALLAHRPRSVAEVRRRLREARFEDGVVDEAIARIVDLGYLDDEAFAAAYAASRADFRGIGARRIVSELLRKGVREDIAKAAADALDRDPEEDALAAASRWWSRIDPTDPRKRRQRLYGYLSRRGYDSETIGKVSERLERDER